MKKTLSVLLGVSVVTSVVAGISGCMGADGTKTLTWVQIGDKPQDYDTVMAAVNEIVEPELGMKLEINYIDSAAFAEKAKMKMASGENYDLIFTGYVNDYQNAVRMGGLMDITDKLDNIMMSDGTTVKMSDVVEGYYLDSAKVGGKLYGIPNAQVISNPACLMIEEPVAEKSGIDCEGLSKLGRSAENYEGVVSFLDALTEEMAKIKSSNPELYTIYPVNPACSNIYEELAGGVGIRRDGSSDEVVVLNTTPENIYGIDTIHKWYEEGYIRNDIASNNSVATTEEQRQYALYQTTWKPGQDIYTYNQRGVNPKYIFYENPYVGRTKALLTMISVGANSKHPEEAVKLIYMLNSNYKNVFNTLCWGIEGVHYKLNDDKTAAEIKGSGYEQVAQNAWKYGNQFNGYVMEGQPADVWEQTVKMNDSAKKSPAIGFVPNTDVIATEIGNIKNIQSEYKAKASFGTSPREEYWDEYMAKLEAGGMEKIRAEIQKQYDEFLASK